MTTENIPKAFKREGVPRKEAKFCKSFLTYGWTSPLKALLVTFIPELDEWVDQSLID
jgi:hypothetical protein